MNVFCNEEVALAETDTAEEVNETHHENVTVWTFEKVRCERYTNEDAVITILMYY